MSESRWQPPDHAVHDPLHCSHAVCNWTDLHQCREWVLSLARRDVGTFTRTSRIVWLRSDSDPDPDSDSETESESDSESEPDSASESVPIASDRACCRGIQSPLCGLCIPVGAPFAPTDIEFNRVARLAVAKTRRVLTESTPQASNKAHCPIQRRGRRSLEWRHQPHRRFR